MYTFYFEQSFNSALTSRPKSSSYGQYTKRVQTLFETLDL